MPSTLLANRTPSVTGTVSTSWSMPGTAESSYRDSVRAPATWAAAAVVNDHVRDPLIPAPVESTAVTVAVYVDEVARAALGVNVIVRVDAV